MFWLLVTPEGEYTQVYEDEHLFDGVDGHFAVMPRFLRVSSTLTMHHLPHGSVGNEYPLNWGATALMRLIYPEATTEIRGPVLFTGCRGPRPWPKMHEFTHYPLTQDDATNIVVYAHLMRAEHDKMKELKKVK